MTLFSCSFYFLKNVKIIHVSQSSEGVSEIYLIIVTYCMHWKVSILEQPSAILFLLWLHKSRERTSSVGILELLGQIYVNSNNFDGRLFSKAPFQMLVLWMLFYSIIKISPSTILPSWESAFYKEVVKHFITENRLEVYSEPLEMMKLFAKN